MRTIAWWAKMKDGKTNVIRSIPISANEQQISAARDAAIRIHTLRGTEGEKRRTYVSPSMDDVSRWVAERGVVDQGATRLSGVLPKWANQIFLNGKRRAVSRKITWSMSKNEFLAIVERCAGLCEVSGVALSLRLSGKKGPYGPSIDRIHPSKGYTADNIRIVCVAMNFAMNEWGLDAFLPIARAVANKHSSDDQIPK